MEMGYLMVLHVRLGAKFGDLHAKDSHSFRKRLIKPTAKALAVSKPMAIFYAGHKKS